MADIGSESVKLMKFYAEHAGMDLLSQALGRAAEKAGDPFAGPTEESYRMRKEILALSFPWQFEEVEELAEVWKARINELKGA